MNIFVFLKEMGYRFYENEVVIFCAATVSLYDDWSSFSFIHLGNQKPAATNDSVNEDVDNGMICIIFLISLLIFTGSLILFGFSMSI